MATSLSSRRQPIAPVCSCTCVTFLQPGMGIAPAEHQAKTCWPECQERAAYLHRKVSAWLSSNVRAAIRCRPRGAFPKAKVADGDQLCACKAELRHAMTSQLAMMYAWTTAVQSATELVTFAHEVVQGNLCDTLAVDAPHKLQQLEEHPHAFSLFGTAILHIFTCKQQLSHDLLAQGMRQDRLNEPCTQRGNSAVGISCWTGLVWACRNATPLGSLVRSPC